MSMTSDLQALRATEAEIVEEFAFFDDWADKYKYIIDLGRALPEFPEALKIDAYKISGCQSQVWLAAEERSGKLFFRGASDALIVSGLIALLLRLYSGREPAAILAAEPDFIKTIDLAGNLSPTRSNGLFSMINTIRRYAAEAKI
jgi:cysteine desulfuration protein SufE